MFYCIIVLIMLGGIYRSLLVVSMCLLPKIVKANVLPLDDALRATYTACVGIDDELSDLKKMAGINTAVTAVGTGLGAGATVVGIVKANKDAKAEGIYETYKVDYLTSDQVTIPSQEEMDALARAFLASEPENEYVKLRDESKKLGNWRTGLLAGSTATNVAGAIIAGNNKVDKDLEQQVKDCRTAINNLRESIIRARVEGGNANDIAEANAIVSACGGYEHVDLSPINKRGQGAMVSSIIGATTGLAGTVTSAVANSENVRKDDAAKSGQKTDADWQKEKNLNTASNVLSGATTVASAAATIFNATQISAIKKVANVAEKCTEVLK